jgi:hypothetical protein
MPLHRRLNVTDTRLLRTTRCPSYTSCGRVGQAAQLSHPQRLEQRA